MTMARITGGSFLALAVAALFAGCSGTTSPSGDGTGGGGGGGGGGTGSTVTVNIQGSAFVGPGGTDAIVVNLGDTVRWVNGDGIAHNATSTAVPAGGNTFASGNLGMGASFEFVPNVTGTWTYRCSIHPATMSGATIVVQ